MNTSDNMFKIRLSASGSTTIAERKRGVVFEVTPDLSEQRTVQYEFIDPVHAPGQIAVFKRSMSRRFTLSSVKLASRSPAEASINLAYLWALRGWTMPNFGKGTAQPRTGKPTTANDPRSSEYIRNLVAGLSEGAKNEYLGAPPQVLELSAYSRYGITDTGINSIGHLHRVPVVIESLSIVYPSDVDYIATDGDSPTPMPTIMSIDISLVETLSPKELNNFNLSKYRLGML